jgi:valyl-tRNA synthetase
MSDTKAPVALEKAFQPELAESRWYQYWEQAGYFKPSGHGDAYCIMLPPPNVTGTLHMGHGFQVSLMDALIRYQRMQGLQTLWQAGTDHAGIATQMVVERELGKEKLSRHDLGREKFIEKVWEWKEHSGNTIKQQLKRMGSSLDWSRECFTMDSAVADAVATVFESLYDEGLIYRGQRLVNWDPILHTAISDLEVVSKEQEGKLWHLRYPFSEGDGFIIVATTRPETLLGDVAVAVHPDDERYQHLIGKTVELPFTGRHIPIIADNAVLKDFGSGCVKITPAHDFNDYAMGQRHSLELINIFTHDAKLNNNAPSAYRGLDRFDAREKILEDLEKARLIVKIEKHIMQIPYGDRSNAVIEPYLTYQWFIKTESLAKPAIDAVKNGDIEFVPAGWQNTYFSWMENIQDWCISRQLWWGHRIPAWYDNEGKSYVGKDETSVRQKYHLSPDLQLRQDEDVLDTWFSSALWPFVTLGWPHKTPEYQTFYPTDVLVTGFDIIFFWVARMVMFGLKFTDQVPFRKVYITGLIRDSEGHKMSKSKGNILDPIDLIDGIDLESLVQKRTRSLMQPQLAKEIEDTTRKEFPEGIPAFGTDALRFTFCALASTGRDIRFDMKRVEGYRNFTNKIWNAARYVCLQIEQSGIDLHTGEEIQNDASQWILSRLSRTVEKVHSAFAEYRFDWIAQSLYEFTWNEYCDWFLELTKPTLFGSQASEAEKRGSLRALITVLEKILLLCHPLMPYITEEIWQTIKPYTGKTGHSIMLESYPQVEAQHINLNIEADVTWLQQIILGIRNIRGEMQISPAKTIPLLLRHPRQKTQDRFQHYQHYVQFLAKIDSITWLTAESTAPNAATAVVDELEILIPMAGLIDKQAELLRLQKEIGKLEKELTSLNGRLNNAHFVDKAPPEVVSKERHRATELNETLATLQTKMDLIAEL